jgi:hypothetical protein
MNPLKTLLSAALAIPFFVFANGQSQKIQILNDDVDAVSDSDVYVLFVGNPSLVTVGGEQISGVRNLSVPPGTVSAAAAADATTVTANNLSALAPLQALPAVPFPILFESGANSGKQVRVTAVNLASGVLTVAADPSSPSSWPLEAQANGDVFVLGAYSQAINTLPQIGTAFSSLSGETRTLYGVDAKNIAAGVIYISRGAPLT